MINSKISIIVPVYNAEKYLKRCIESIVSQTYENIEVIIINDGSTDNSSYICSEAKKKDVRIKYYEKKNGGVSSARNYGMNKASGDYVVFVDSDDRIDKNVVKSLASGYCNQTLVGCRIVSCSDKNSRNIFCKNKYDVDEVLGLLLNNNLQGYIPGYLFERKKCPRFDERTGYCEDMIFLIDYLRKSRVNQIIFLPKNCGVYKYLQHGESITNSKHNVLKKLRDIETAMSILDEKTNMNYTKLISDKKVSLFEYEMQHADSDDFKKILDTFEICGYNGRSFRMKYFSYIYRKKNISAIVRYYKIRKAMKNIASRFKGR